MTYEEMQKSHNDLNIVELDLSEVSGLKGFYYAGNIAIEKKLSSIEKSCVLAEELGHHYTSYGDIMDQDIVQNRKQELRARLRGYDLQIGLADRFDRHRRMLQTPLPFSLRDGRIPTGNRRILKRSSGMLQQKIWRESCYNR